MNEGSLLGDIESYFDTKGREQDEANGVSVIRPTSGHSPTNLDLFYKKLEELGINLEELKPVLECQDNLLVLSGAGAGKTTGLMLKIIRDLVSGDMMKTVTTTSVYGTSHIQVPSKILVSTFLKSGAEDLKKSFIEWCRKLGVVGIDYSNIHFKTIHAEVMDTLKQMGVGVSILEDSQPLARAIMGKYSIRSVNSTARSVTIDELNDFQGIVAYARNRLDAKRYEHTLMGDYRMDITLLDAVLKDLQLMRRATGKMDFEDLQEMLLEGLLTNENVRNFVQNRYDYVYVDEFQDTAQLQYGILKEYFKGAKRVITIGDDDQTIYSWRGSDIDIIKTTFIEDFNPTILNLTTNYRCRQNILNSVIPSIELNQKRHPKDLKAFKPGGEVNVIYQGNVNMLVDTMRADLVKGYSVGVLARVNADLLIPAIILELDGGIDFALSKSVNMNNRLSRQVFGAIDLVTKRMTGEFENYLRMVLPKYNWFEAEKLINVLKNNKSLNLYNIPMDDLTSSVPSLAPFIKGLRSSKEIGGVEAYLFILGYLEQNVFTGKSLYVVKARSLIQFVKRVILEHKDVKNLDINAIDNLFNQVLPERLSRRGKYSQTTRVKLTTIHEAKGKEWDSVVIWNNVNGAFPNIVGNRELTEDEFEEERRIHYIAWTRAIEKLTVFSDVANEGLFLKECDLSVVGANIQTMDKQLDMSRVFKKANTVPSTQEFVEKVLNAYIVKTSEKGGSQDDKYVNMDIVLNTMQRDDIVEQLDKKYGIHLNTEKDDYNNFDLLDDFFSTLADEIFNSGSYRA